MKFKWKKCFKITALCWGILFIIVAMCAVNGGNLFKTLTQKNNFNKGLQNTIQLRKINDSNTTVKFDHSQYETYKVIGSCKNVSFPFHLSRRAFWSATDTRRNAYVYSAYLPDSNKTVIVGIKTGHHSKYFCQIWYLSSNKQHVKMDEYMAQIIYLPESHGLRFTSVLYQCTLPPSTELPTHVSIVSKSCETPINLLEITSISKPNNTGRRFTVCLTPLHFNYNRDYEMIEWIELNKLLGAEKFVIYNYTSSAINVKPVLDYYSNRGLTEVLQWNLPVGVNTWPKVNKPVEIHYFGQIAALHDCLYRNKGISEFIVNLDVDEYIIPHGKEITTWSEMLTQLKQNSNVYLFRNTFFKKEWNNKGIEIKNKEVVDKLRLVTLQKLQHERKLSLPRQRSKYFAKSAFVDRLMIHEVPGVKNEAVPVDIGLLHHYRNWETKNDPEYVKVFDKTVPDKFSESLIKNIQKVWSDLKISKQKES